MALYKLLTNEKGVEYSYHRILAYSMNFADNTISVNVASYKDEEYRALEKKTGDEKILNNVGLSLPIIDEQFDRISLYERIKNEVEMFYESKDI
jgi:hypothetical protein